MDTNKVGFICPYSAMGPVVSLSATPLKTRELKTYPVLLVTKSPFGMISLIVMAGWLK